MLVEQCADVGLDVPCQLKQGVAICHAQQEPTDAQPKQNHDPLGQVASITDDGAVDCRSSRGGNSDLKDQGNYARYRADNQWPPVLANQRQESPHPAKFTIGVDGCPRRLMASLDTNVLVPLRLRLGELILARFSAGHEAPPSSHADARLDDSLPLLCCRAKRRLRRVPDGCTGLVLSRATI